MKKVAVLAAREAGKILLRHYGKTTVKRKARFEIVTEADVAAEKVIVKILRKNFPEHAIIGEEKTKDSEKEFTWFVDPVDGTNNFSHGYPFFCVSIGLRKGNEFVLGVIFDPLRKELFAAEKGKGAFLNGKRISVSKTSKLKDCIVISGFGYDRGMIMRRNLKRIGRILPRVLVIRRSGSAALDLVYVAAGRAEAFWESNLKPWDIAAGVAIVEEAGGKVTNLKGKPLNERCSIAATNGLIHKRFIRLLNQKG